MSDNWATEALAQGWLQPAKVAKMREELYAALSCLPSDEALVDLVDKVNGGELKDDADPDKIEEVMEFHDALGGTRDALNFALTLLPT